MNNSTYHNNPHFFRQNYVRIADISHHGASTYLQTTATPTGMQSAKLGQDTKYLRVIGRVEGVHSVGLHYVHRVTDKQTNQLQYFAPASGRSND